jgi:hypothetical protein
LSHIYNILFNNPVNQSRLPYGIVCKITKLIVNSTCSKLRFCAFLTPYIISAAIGGTAEALGGGKFANGAVTGAWVMMLNHMGWG